MAHDHIRMNPASQSHSENASGADGDTRPLGFAADDSVVAPQLLLALFTAKDLEALIDTAFGVVRAAVVCDFASAFYVSAGNGLLKERDSLGRESCPAFMRRYVELTPALPIAKANCGIKIILTRTSLPLSTAKLQRSAFYREVMQLQGWRHRSRWSVHTQPVLPSRRSCSSSTDGCTVCPSKRRIDPCLCCRR